MGTAVMFTKYQPRIGVLLFIGSAGNVIGNVARLPKDNMVAVHFTVEKFHKLKPFLIVWSWQELMLVFNSSLDRWQLGKVA